MACACCAEKFNQSTRKEIVCFNCQYTSCKTCIRTFLTTNGQSKCMNCNTQFNMSFIVRHLNQSWTLNEFKQTMTNTILSSELGKIPETLPYAETEKRKRALQAKNLQLKKRADDLSNQLKQVQNAVTANNYLIRGERVPDRYNNELVTDEPIRIDTRKKFIMACPGANCKGFLSTAYKCGLCEQYTCKDCITIKQNEQHVCIESDKLSAEAIRKETKPCPKCNERIYKIDGCDQMFCMARSEGGVVCATVWSWKSGEEEVGVTVHNPHYFALQREKGYVPRNAGDVHCGGLPDLSPFNQLFRYIFRYTLVESEKEKIREFTDMIHMLYRRMAEHIQYEITRLRTSIRQHPENMKKNRINYILTSLSKTQFAEIQYKTEKDYQKSLELLHTFELIGICGIETFQMIVQEIPSIDIYESCREIHPEYIHDLIESSKKKLENFYSVIDFCNDKFKEISVTYHATVPIFSKNGYITNKKFKVNGEEIKKPVFRRVVPVNHAN
jgi:hypothetical protein